jgi:hypothetical protein
MMNANCYLLNWSINNIARQAGIRSSLQTANLNLPGGDL